MSLANQAKLTSMLQLTNNKCCTAKTVRGKLDLHRCVPQVKEYSSCSSHCDELTVSEVIVACLSLWLSVCPPACLCVQAFVQLGSPDDAEMLVKYYSMNPLTIKGRQIRLNICTKYKTLE